MLTAIPHIWAVMFKASATKGSIILSIMICSVILLLLITGSLYMQNRYYRQENRQLIIRNDSIISVNIELQSALRGSLHNNVRKTSYEVKKETN